MSVHVIYIKDGAKMMRPVLTREEYLSLRNGGEQQQLVARIRAGEEGLKHKLLQMNYSCLPNEDGTLKGSTRMSTTVGMDIDHLTPDEMPAVRERILAKKDELGLKMMEESARGCGYHLVFARRPELSQKENLKWASELISVAYDSGAKDITRVFFTTSGNELIYLDDAIFELEEVLGTDYTDLHGLIKSSDDNNSCNSRNSCQEKIRVNPCNPCQNKDSHDRGQKIYPTQYHGIPFDRIIKKYWEVNNQGYEPTEGDRDTLTYQLACDLRHICGKNADWLDQVIPCYDGFTPEEKRAKIQNALSSEYNGFPQRLRNTLNALTSPNLPKGEESQLGEEEDGGSIINSQLSIKRMPQGVRESIDAVGPSLAMPVVTAICPCIGTLATGVQLDVHGTKRGLNLISYIAGDFASGKGGIDTNHAGCLRCDSRPAAGERPVLFPRSHRERLPESRLCRRYER